MDGLYYSGSEAERNDELVSRSARWQVRRQAALEINEVVPFSGAEIQGRNYNFNQSPYARRVCMLGIQALPVDVGSIVRVL